MATMLARSRCFVCAQAPARPAVQRSVRMVVRASASKTPFHMELPAIAKPAIAALVGNVIMALPAAAEAGKIFDFNATLPVMASEFLILMVFLDKFWFTPVGKVLDARDKEIREKLGSVRDNSGELQKLAQEATDIIRAARTEVSSMINSKKSAKQAELDKQYNETKAAVQKEVDTSIAGVEKESQKLLASLDAQVDKISNEVLRRVLPQSVKV